MKFKLNNTFSNELPADTNLENSRRKVFEACFSYVNPKPLKNASLIHVSDAMLEALNISETEAQSQTFLDYFSGSKLIPDSKPYAMCYGGHQFGHWAGQLGDGRAINLVQIEVENENYTLQLKGAGETPYSRNADGLAVLRSSIREYLCSEAMHYLGVPTTRALSLVLSGDEVLRDMLYDGNSAYEKGAVVCRVAPSFIRFGNFEIFAARNDKTNLKKLVDYTIKNHFQYLGKPDKESYLQFLEDVLNRTLKMIIEWQRVGFVHGVMNTDNMSILGLTIDYGPYGWLEDYNPNWTPNTTDSVNRRYRFGQQLQIGLWNVLQLANALYPLIEDAPAMEAILQKYNTKSNKLYLEMMRSKLGLAEKDENDLQLIQQLETVLQLSETDMTIFFRNLGDYNSEESSEALKIIEDAFYKPEEITNEILQAWKDWFTAYKKRLETESLSFNERQKNMNAVNPKYVLRNYMAQLAIDAANKGDYTLIDELYTMLKLPYDEQPKYQKWFAKRPDWARHKVGCSMLSCSS